MTQFGTVARKVGHAVPGVHSSYHGLRFLLWRQRIRQRSRTTMEGAIDPHRTLWVDPKAIRLACVWGPESYRKFDDRGTVLDGPWDRDVQEFESLDVYRAMREHFLDGRPWNETDYYQRVLGQVLGGYHKRGMTSRADVDARCADLDRLYQTIRDEGYKALAAIRPRPFPWTGYEDEVSVRIGRDGDLLFEDGRHRLAIAKLLGVERIPVKVTVRHRMWFAFVRRVQEYARGHGGRVEYPVSHPDLDDIPARHGHESFELIREQLPRAGGTALDLGCWWGYHCGRLEEQGFRCTGIEPDGERFSFAQRLRRAEGREFELVNASSIDHEPLGTDRFDVVLSLDLLDKLARDHDQRDRLAHLLGRLRMQALVLGCEDDASGGAGKVGHQGHEAASVVDVVLRHSGLSRARLIGTTPGRKHIYLLEP